MTPCAPPTHPTPFSCPRPLQAATIDVCRATPGADYEPIARAVLPLHPLLLARDGRVGALTLPLRGRDGRVVGSLRVAMRVAVPLAQVRRHWQCVGRGKILRVAVPLAQVRRHWQCVGRDGG